MHIREIFSDFVSLFYPALCVGCSEPLPRGVAHICVKCRYDLPKTSNHILQIETLNEKFRNIVDLKYLLVYCYFYKGSVFQQIIHHLKYEHQPEIARMLARWYAEELRSSDTEMTFDYAVPVPLHRSKRVKRGYNQAEMICEGLSTSLEAEIIPDALFRIKPNQSLTGLNKVERMTTLNETYLLNVAYRKALKGKDILLVDDIMTTGSTLIACYEALKETQPASISFLVLGAAQ